VDRRPSISKTSWFTNASRNVTRIHCPRGLMNTEPARRRRKIVSSTLTVGSSFLCVFCCFVCVLLFCVCFVVLCVCCYLWVAPFSSFSLFFFSPSSSSSTSLSFPSPSSPSSSLPFCLVSPTFPLPSSHSPLRLRLPCLLFSSFSPLLLLLLFPFFLVSPAPPSFLPSSVLFVPTFSSQRRLFLADSSSLLLTSSCWFLSLPLLPTASSPPAVLLLYSCMVHVESGSRPPSWPQNEVNILIDSVTSH